MPGYAIANYKVTDAEAYATYTKSVLPSLKKYGGKPLVVNHQTEAVEGEANHQTIVLEFESVERAKEWYHSEEYKDVKAIRIAATEGMFIISDGFAPKMKG